MPNLFTRTIATLLWLSERFEKIKKSKYGLVSIFVFVAVVGLVVATPVHAQDVISSLLMIFANLAISVAALLSKLVIAIIEILIPVMLYNKFSTSPVVSMGWAIVRDTVNMFFVIVLIVIAFGTIFGHSKFQWQQQVPKLMIFALVINFSKTLCGLMIDVGQVIMLTFANALREVAAGNFLQMLGLTDIYALSENNSIFNEAAKSSTAEGAKAFDWFASSLAALFMMLAVLVTMIMLLVILVYRVVMLWVLIVISPIAWFIGGAKGLISSNAYDDWWNKFKCLVAIGPILTFFLWLTLVVAGAGNIANDDKGFDTASGDSGLGGTAGGMLTTIFELDKLISFVIGIAMLYAGFEAAQSACSSMTGGFLGAALKKGSPQASLGIAKGVAGAGAKVGGWGARKAGAGIKFAGGGALKMAGAAVEDNKYLGWVTKKGRGDLYKNLAGKTGNTWVGKIAGRKLSNMSDTLGAKRREEISKAGEKYKGDSTDTKADQLIRMGENPPATVGGKREAQALLMEAMKNPKLMAKLRASGKFDKIWNAHGGGLEKDMGQDDEATDTIKKFKIANADLTGSANLINSEEDVKSLSTGALANKGVQEKLAGITTKIMDKNTGELMTAAEAMSKGLYGAKEAAIFNAGEGGAKRVELEKMQDHELKRVESDRLVEHGSPDVLARGVDLALKDRNTDKADRILSKLLAKLQDDKTTSDEKVEINSTLDKIQSNLTNSLGGGGVAMAGSLAFRRKSVQDADEKRAAAKEVEDRSYRDYDDVVTVGRGNFDEMPMSNVEDVQRFASALSLATNQLGAGIDHLSQARGQMEETDIIPALNNLLEQTRTKKEALKSQFTQGSPEEKAQVRAEFGQLTKTEKIINEVGVGVLKYKVDVSEIQALSGQQNVPQELIDKLNSLNEMSSSIEKLTMQANKKKGKRR